MKKMCAKEVEDGQDETLNTAQSLEKPTPSKNKRKCPFCKLGAAAIVIGVVLYVVLDKHSEEGAYQDEVQESAQDLTQVPWSDRNNIFYGRWVPAPSGPSYNDRGCHFIDSVDDCIKNGRPDLQYLYWRWEPYHSELPPFDPVVFMNAMRDKYWALIGDSILRNQMQSLVCLLSEVEEPVEIYHDASYKSRTVYFPAHNFTVATIWAPFLVRANVSENNEGKDAKEIQLYIDALNPIWTTDYHKYDYIIISGGQWFLKTAVVWENGKVIGCHNCAKKNISEIGVEYAYRKTLTNVLDFIALSDHNPLVFFRTWSPDHFEYGEWFSGGVCNRTLPYKDGQYNGKLEDHKMRRVELEVYEKARAQASRRGIRIELLDIFHLSVLRPDGHPGPYRTFHPFDKDKNAKVQNDCLHWCLPGPVDTWNEIMMKIMLNIGALNSSTLSRKDIQGSEFVFSQ